MGHSDALHPAFLRRHAIIAGKSTNPVCQTGDRVVHLGVVETAFPAHVSDGHV